MIIRHLLISLRDLLYRPIRNTAIDTGIVIDEVGGLGAVTVHRLGAGQAVEAVHKVGGHHTLAVLCHGLCLAVAGAVIGGGRHPPGRLRDGPQLRQIGVGVGEIGRAHV